MKMQLLKSMLFAASCGSNHMASQQSFAEEPTDIIMEPASTLPYVSLLKPPPHTLYNTVLGITCCWAGYCKHFGPLVFKKQQKSNIHCTLSCIEEAWFCFASLLQISLTLPSSLSLNHLRSPFVFILAVGIGAAAIVFALEACKLFLLGKKEPWNWWHFYYILLYCGSKIVFNKDWAMLLPKQLLSEKKILVFLQPFSAPFFGRPAQVHVAQKNWQRKLYKYPHYSNRNPRCH